MENKENGFWKDNKYVLILLGILLFAFVLRVWVFYITANQPVWWDEGDYLTEAKRIGLGLNTRNIWYYRRVFFLPLFWAGLFKLGAGEWMLRFTEFMFSFVTVLLTYLVGKEMFNKKVGLIAAAGMSFCRIHLFLTGRLLTAVPSTCFFLLGLFFFWKGYVKKERSWYILLAGLFIGLGLFTRFALFLCLVAFGIFILCKERLRFWKNKHVWVFFLLILLILTPFFIKYKENYPGGIKDFILHYTGKKEGMESIPFMRLGGVWAYFKNMIENTSWPIFILFLVGCSIFINLFCGLDLIFKNKETQKSLFILLWILAPLVYHGWYSPYVQERYLTWVYPVIFMLSGVGLLKVTGYIKKYNKNLANIFIVLILLSGAYMQVGAASDIINLKKDSYLQVKEAGLWMKEHTNVGDNVLSQSAPQNTYYSERSTHGYDETVEEFEKNLKILKPKYASVSMFEYHPGWVYEYFEKNTDRFKPVQVYLLKDNPILIIYEIL